MRGGFRMYENTALGSKKEIDLASIEKHIRAIIEAIGDDPNREGLLDTPSRVANMYAEVFRGMCYTNHEIADMFNKTFEDDPDSYNNSNDLVLVKDIEVFSYCEHHMALMYDMKVSVAYIPCGKVIGLSKIARIADLVCKRLQIQERIGADIAEIMQMITESPDIAVVIEASHSCMTARGIQKTSAKTTTRTLRGKFETELSLVNQLIN